jgi:hypothetical protein
MAGAGVPLRLSATEIEDDDEFENEVGGGAPYQAGFGGRDDDWGVDPSFYGSSRAPESHRRTGSGRSSDGSRSNTLGDRYALPPVLPPNGHNRSTSDGPMDRLDEKTPIATNFGSDRDYFTTTRKDSNASTPEDDEEREKREDELRRRGSVDDRAMTMSGVRLFVANPDLDD